MGPASERLEDPSATRLGAFAKDASSEAFLRALNEYLEPRERSLYRDHEIRHPFVFVVGPPRSGTTLLSQVLAYCFDAGYVTNVAARFWLAPVHGIRLSALIAGEACGVSFESEYARTKSPLDIHEFGYFWRRWLRKDTFDDVVHAREREDAIDWDGLGRTLANVQAEFDRPFVAKNILGGYHMPRLRELLGRVVWVSIERDPLDSAVSILDARRRYHADPRTWWSYVPLEHSKLRDLDHWEQIAGQVHYLRRFYRRALAEAGDDVAVRVTYEQLARRPADVLDAVADRIEATFGSRPALRRRPPESFSRRSYGDDREGEKERFAPILERLAGEEP